MIAGRFKLGRAVGEGGMGTVYRALDRLTGATVALKVLRGHRTVDLARFDREVAVLSTLDHPGIVRFVAWGSTPEGDPFLAMDWLEGEDLAARIARGPLAVDDAVRIALTAADALSVAHEAGVVHRDVKPANLFLRGLSDAVTLLDFGLARCLADDAVDLGGGPLGTPEYMAPEQVRATGRVDARADVFSLGCVIFECLAGCVPFRGEHAIAVMATVLLDEAPRLRRLRPTVPAALDDLVARMLAKDPAGRPADAGVVAAALRAMTATAATPRARSDADPRWEGAQGHLGPATEGWYQAISEQIVASGRIGHYDRVEALVALAGETGAPAEARAAQLASLCRAGLELAAAGRFAAVDTILARLECLGRDFDRDDLALTAQLHLLHGARALHLGDPGTCLDGLRAALAAQLQIGDARGACVTRSKVGGMFLILGDPARAEAALRQTLEAAERMGWDHLAAVARRDLGTALAHLGRFDEALAVEESARAVFETTGDVRLTGESQTLLARVALQAGDAPRSEREARAAVGILVDIPRARAEALATLALALVALGRHAEAIDTAARAQSLAAHQDPDGDHGDFGSCVGLAWVEALTAAGDRRAPVASGEAWEAALARASRIREPQWRSSYLHCAPENARTLELARTWGWGDTEPGAGPMLRGKVGPTDITATAEA